MNSTKWLCPEPTLFSWVGWPGEPPPTPHPPPPPPPHPHPPPLPPATLPNAVSSRLAGHSDPPLFSNPLTLSLDIQVCHECPSCSRFHWLLKVTLDMCFSAQCTKFLKLNRIYMTIISKVAWKCIWCGHRVQWCVTAPHMRENCAVRR